MQKVNETFEIDGVRYVLDFRIIEGDVDLPQNAFNTTEFAPQGCFCVYSNHHTLEYVRDSFEKTLLSNLEEDDRLPFNGLPLVLLFSADPNTNEKDIAFLREEGELRARSLQCPFIDVTTQDNRLDGNGALSTDSQSLGSGLSGDVQERWFNEECLSRALRALVDTVQRKTGYGQIYQSASLSEGALNPEIRLLMCFLCGDNFSVQQVLDTFLIRQPCYVTSIHSIVVEVTIGESKRFVELIFTSYHGAQAYRDELLHGFVLVYSAQRQASLSTLSAFSNNIPNTPTQILAVTDTPNSAATQAIFASDGDELSTHLVAEGNLIADKINAHFMTTNSQQKNTFFASFLEEVWDRKPQIEKAFEMDDSDYSGEHHTPVPTVSRQGGQGGPYGGEGHEPNIYEQLPSGQDPSPDAYLERTTPLSPSDDSDIYTSVLAQHANGSEQLVKPSQLKNRRSLQAGMFLHLSNHILSYYVSLSLSIVFFSSLLSNLCLLFSSVSRLNLCQISIDNQLQIQNV